MNPRELRKEIKSIYRDWKILDKISIEGNITGINGEKPLKEQIERQIRFADSESEKLLKMIELCKEMLPIILKRREEIKNLAAKP